MVFERENNFGIYEEEMKLSKQLFRYIESRLGPSCMLITLCVLFDGWIINDTVDYDRRAFSVRSHIII